MFIGHQGQRGLLSMIRGNRLLRESPSVVVMANWPVPTFREGNLFCSFLRFRVMNGVR